MKMILKAGAILAMCTIGLSTLTACNNSEQETNSYSEGIKTFSADNNTVKFDENSNSDNTDTGNVEHIFIPSELPHADIGTISLVGKDLSTDYSISGNDIVYDGVTYQGLNKAVNSIKTPYDKVTFTNFIVKTFTPKSDKVFVSYINEEENTGIQASTTLDAELSMSWEGYKTVRDKYNSVAVWSLNLRDNGGKTADIIGNKDYMLQGSVSKDMVIDMSKYDTREDKSDTSVEENTSVSEPENSDTSTSDVNDVVSDVDSSSTDSANYTGDVNSTTESATSRSDESTQSNSNSH